ncbi:uncharacterized protein Z518_03582 [Rhinocladiella mackenziei CBS 650.93]|uniref:Uncharacterized protein n=1 Tax=Rhinocladiella mackenziei CBS 650.93 TaxID=1442369 RepID=A0A0D2J917_9EURO|nr:uncharacterized protein Z518_03582 [Rhinocladiella mackenziei CBS 650.93]KIX05610.1 hypothetical protein Z518_03582 [Rhinocladiella mackenziei CBS 650.93]
MAINAAGPTTPPRLPTTAPSAPAPARHTSRQKAKAPRVRAATENELETTNNAREEAENTEYQPDTYITMISSVLGPVARKLETLGEHVEGLNNNIGTNNTKTHALEKQIMSFLTTVKNNEALTRTLLEASKWSETCTAELWTRIVKLESQNNTLLEVIKHNETTMAKLEMQNKVLLEAVKQYEVRVAKLEAQNNSLLETVKKSATEQAKTTETPSRKLRKHYKHPSSSTYQTPADRVEDFTQLKEKIN